MFANICFFVAILGLKKLGVQLKGGFRGTGMHFQHKINVKLSAMDDIGKKIFEALVHSSLEQWFNTQMKQLLI